MRSVKIIVLLLLAAFAIYYYVSDDTNSAAKSKKDNVIQVTAVPVTKGSINIFLDALGTVTPRSSVTIRSRVDGQLMNLHFNEGQLVTAGDLLAELDARPFEAQLKQAQGQKLRNEALLNEARQTLERYKALVEKDSIPRQQLDTQTSVVKQYEGAVKNDQGLLDIASTQLDYTRITSPISGRIGLRMVDVGNIVKASDANGIAVITEIDPITVVFSLPEDRIPALMQRQGSSEPVQVEAWNRESTIKLADGTLSAVDNQVDPSTGTLKARAEFKNTDNALFPNQFVNIRLKLGTKDNALLIPTAALQRGSKGTFVYRVKDDNTAEAVPITVGVTEGDKISVDSSLTEGDKIVLEGASMLRDGGKISLESKSKEPPQAK